MNEWIIFLCKWWEPILASVSEFERKYNDGWIQHGKIQHGRIQDGCQYQFRWEWLSLSQIEFVWVSIRVEWECFWVNLREDNKVSESKMAVSESNMVEFKMTAIIKLSQNEWVKFFCAKRLKPTWQNSRWLPSSSWVKRNEWIYFFVQMVGTNLGKCEWVWKEILWWLNPRWPNSRWQNSRWLPSSSWVRMNEWSFFVQNDWSQHGRYQDGCHLQVNLIELIWFRVRVEWECFWVNLREDNKVSESKMAVSQSNMTELKMAAIIKLSRNEWVKFYCSNGGNQSWQVWVSMRGKTKIAESKMAKFKMAEFKMAASIKLSQNEWVKFYCANGGNQSWHEWVSLKENTKMADSKMAKFKMAEFKIPAMIKLSENEWVWVRLN